MHETLRRKTFLENSAVFRSGRRPMHCLKARLPGGTQFPKKSEHESLDRRNSDRLLHSYAAHFLRQPYFPQIFFRTAVFPASAAAFRRKFRGASCRNGQPASLHGSRSLRMFQEPCRSKKAVPQCTARSIKKRPEKRGVESFAAHVPKRRKQGPKGAGRKDILPVMHGARGPGSYLW